jgi:CDP-paratose 2-epimerase
MRLLITGGAGFIGTNAVSFFLPKAKKIYVLDNFFRPTSKKNAKYLKALSNKIEVIESDLKNRPLLNRLVKKTNTIIHLAAQVAVTSSLKDPYNDFLINALGSVNLLESVRENNPNLTLIYASTNKVYGDLKKTKINRAKGISESTPIDLFSPYGCSKGAADLYFLDYARSFSLKTVVFRQSCIYGPHQYGIEDQGWLAYFALRIKENKPITIFGTGKQVRDLLYVNDLLKAYDMAITKIKKTKGQVFNIGGGPDNALSLFEAIAVLEKKLNKKARLRFGPRRLGDQNYFVSDNTKIKKVLGWKPETSFNSGLDYLLAWFV